MLRNWLQILLIAIPSLVTFATQTVTGTINLIMVGQLGFVIIAIVGVSNIIMYNAFAIFSGIGHTVSYLVAQNYGSNDMRKGLQRTYLAMYMCIFFAVVIFVTGWLAADDILRWTGGSEELVHQGGYYLELRFYAMSFGIINFAFHGFLRGIGSTTMSMIVSLISNLLMIFLTYVLTFGHWGFPHLGLTGAGLAVIIGEGVQLFICVYIFFFILHKRYQTRSRVAAFSFDWPEIKLIAQESGKLGMQEFSLSVSMFIFTAFVARLGDHALAANEVALNV
ncbi:MATE family efflux transporter, partial [Paenibacillus sepulcri]|nr:MATE family efflux transporter [Paenibacillus sepulcri]